ncbi:MAG TPA: biotin-dependent carboxyltransferase family protein, partial [Gemmatimonadaceae bacterium]
MTIHIIGAGLQTTVQDLGRAQHQHEGIPGSGAMDRTAHRVANILVGNSESAATLESTLIGPAMTFDKESLIAVTGGDLGATVDGAPLALWAPTLMPAGSTLRFGKVGNGCRAYVAIAGGIHVPEVFDSRSTYLRASFGGFSGRALRVGDALDVFEPTRLGGAIARSLGGSVNGARHARWSAGHTIRPAYREDVTVRLIEGAHTSELDDASLEALTATRFRVSSSSDRMGYRLEGAKLALAKPREMMSEAVAFGTVQLPPGGAPIVLMADRQTTGGYPRIGEVASVDLPLVAQ